MTFIRKKKVGDKVYLVEVKNVRENGKIKQKYVRYLGKEMNGKPFIGGFTSGEQGNIKGYGCFHGSLSSAMIVFGDE